MMFMITVTTGLSWTKWFTTQHNTTFKLDVWGFEIQEDETQIIKIDSLPLSSKFPSANNLLVKTVSCKADKSVDSN